MIFLYQIYLLFLSATTLASKNIDQNEPYTITDSNNISASRLANRDRIFLRSEKFSFVHISKCAGESFILEFRNSKLMHTFYPQRPSGAEHGVLFDVNIRHGYNHLILVRSPMSHVQSMFEECRNVPWGIKTFHDREKKGLPTIPHRSTFERDFDEWITYYTHPLEKPFLGCYNPWNYQSRHLTCSRESCHDIDNNLMDTDPSEAINTLENLDFVGLTDFFHESKCLLIGRFGKGMSEDSSAEAYYSSTCRCPLNINQYSDKHVNKHNRTMTIPDSLKVKIDRLVEVDTYMYRVALRMFFMDIKRHEQTVGRRILCDSSLEKKLEHLAYLGNVKEIYYMVEPNHLLKGK